MAKKITNLLVKKFGGTSMGTIERIERAATIIADDIKQGKHVAAVVSAMSGETNRLISLANQISPTLSPREMDVLSSSGEQVSAGLLTLALQKQNINAQSFLGWQVPINTDNAYAKSRILSVAPNPNDPIHCAISNNITPVIAGFQGIDKTGAITTLGRGGSDTTAVAIAIALQAQECQIYTDVTGVFTADPRRVPHAKRLNTISFEEMLEMASLGSKVLQIRAVELAGTYHIPLRVLSSFTPDTGTLITLNQEETTMNKPLESAHIAGIAHELDEAQITVSGLADMPGVAASILTTISTENIEVDMIVQNVGLHGKADLTFTVNRRDHDKALTLLKNNTQHAFNEIVGNTEVVKVSLVGVGMRSHAGIAAKMFQILASQKINIIAISTSEIKISVLINEASLNPALNALHDTFCID